VAGELFANMADIVPYRGTGPALTGLLGGHIPVVFAPVPATHENAKNRLIRMLGAASIARSSLVPDMPTIAEQGLPGYGAVLRYGLVARPIIERLNKELRAVLPATICELVSRQSEQSHCHRHRRNTRRISSVSMPNWSALVKSLGLKAERRLQLNIMDGSAVAPVHLFILTPI
jgi:tripartite-type tricarboxylate transporter receptor subunit TctC